MTTFQKVIKYLAIALAIFLSISIVSGILGAFGLFGGFFSNHEVTGDMKTYTVNDDITSLNIKINAADFTIKQGDFKVESNLKHLTVENKKGILTINETKKSINTYNDAVLILYIPSNTVFEDVVLTTGASRLTAYSLSAQRLKFELGAGDVKFDTLTATSKADIDGGAGKITISDAALNNLDFDMGVGQLNIASSFTGESEFDLGVGESNITILGDKSDYRLDIEKGVGSITVDGEKVSNEIELGSGQNYIEVNGGVGAINVSFK